MKTLLALVITTGLIPQRVSAQPPDAFEVASVKPAGPVPSDGGRGNDAASGIGAGCDGSFPKLEGNRFSVTTTPYALITWAYGYNKVWGCSFVNFGDLLTGGRDGLDPSDLKFRRLCRKARRSTHSTSS